MRYLSLLATALAVSFSASAHASPDPAPLPQAKPAITSSVDASAKTKKANLKAVRAEMERTDICSMRYNDLVNKLPKSERTAARDKSVAAKCRPITVSGTKAPQLTVKEPLYQAPPSVQSAGSFCDRYGQLAGIGGSGYVLSTGVTVGGKAKNVRQDSTGVNTSWLGFLDVGAEVNVCKTFSQGFWGRARVGYEAGLNGSDQNYPGGYERTNKEDRSVYVGADLMGDLWRDLALGGGLGYSFDSLRAVTDGPAGYHDDQKARGQFLHLTAVADYALARNWDIELRYTYKIATTLNTPSTDGKPYEHAIRASVFYRW